MAECVQFRDESMQCFIERITDTFTSYYGRKHNVRFYRFRRGVIKRWLREGMRNCFWQLMCSSVVDGDDNPTWEELVSAAHDAECLYYLLNPKPWQPAVPHYNSANLKVNSDGFAIVYTDGACFRNGQPGAQAGIGVWFGHRHRLNVSEPLDPDEPATNNVAEIRAVIRAVEIAKQCGVGRLAIKTDSTFLINSLTQWILNWLSNGWETSSGGRVKHKYLYREYLEVAEDMTIKFEYVRSHSDVEGNEMADKFAKAGAAHYEPDF